MDKRAKIFVAGHRGLLGSALVRKLNEAGYANLIVRTHAELDLLRQDQVERFFAAEKPDVVLVAAAKVGGIVANNTARADFIYQNLIMSANLIHAAWQAKVAKLVYFGSTCIYPRDCPQPIREDYLLSGPLEQTNEPYAIAKIAGLKMVESYNRQYGTNYISLMPTNLYGPNDNFDLVSSHVLPAMIRKFHEAKLRDHGPVSLWGSGSPRREFLHVDDCALACVFALEKIDAGAVPGNLINVGCGDDLTIRQLAELVQKTVGHHGVIEWDASKPDGTPRKMVDVGRLMGLGWRPTIALVEGLRQVYAWFLANRTAPAADPGSAR